MQLGTGAGTLGVRSGGLARSLPSLVELLLVLAAIAVLLPAFARVAEFGDGRDRRFADAGLRLQGLPEPILPAMCSAYAARAEAALREGLCPAAGFGAAPAALPLTRLPAPLAQAVSRAGAVDPLPLSCAARWVGDMLAEPAAGAGVETAKANAVLLLAAAVDGHAAVESLAAATIPPGTDGRRSPPCHASAVAALAATAASMADARQSLSNARKNEALRALMQTAGSQWAGAMLLGYGMLLWSRRRWPPALGVGAALLLWALAGWFARVPWPLAGNRAFQPARLEPALWSPPAGFVQWLVAAGALVLSWSLIRGRAAASTAAAPAQAMSSRIGYAGLVLATGLGWLLLLDLSAHGHFGNRYLALYHQGHLWLGMLVFSVLLFLRQPLSRGLAWMLSIGGETARRSAQRLGPAFAVAALLLAALAAVVAFALTLANMRQLTSELGRVWLIVGAAWFFFLRAGPLAERLARSGPAGVALWRYVWPLLWVVGVLVAAMVLTRDMGPLLIAGYGSGAFVAATLAMWWHQRSSGTAWADAWAHLLAIGLFAAWVGMTTAALFRLGAADSVTAARLESLAAPFASTNDQLALVSWFQRAAPAEGFGVGNVPWCGYSPAGSCSGVPAQIHSDYTFTAIVGVFGAMAAWAAALGCAVWLHRLIRHHGRVTRGEPRLVAAGGQIANDGQALLSWIGVAWVVLSLCQLAVTVAGNLAVLPLTGVTFPFVSFGMTSLLVNLAFLALCLNVDLPPRGSDG